MVVLIEVIVHGQKYFGLDKFLPRVQWSVATKHLIYVPGHSICTFVGDWPVDARHECTLANAAMQYFSPMSLGILGVWKDINILRLLSYCFPVDGPYHTELAYSPFEIGQHFIATIHSPIRWRDRRKVCMWERGRLGVCISVNMYVSRILHLSYAFLIWYHQMCVYIHASICTSKNGK